IIFHHNNISDTSNDVVNNDLSGESWGHKTNKRLNSQMSWSRQPPVVGEALKNETGRDDGSSIRIIDQLNEHDDDGAGAAAGAEEPQKDVESGDDDEEESSGKTLMMRRRPRRSVV